MTLTTRRLILLVVAAAVALVAVGGASAARRPNLRHFGRAATLIVRSDTDHAKKGPDGKWHDAFLPADFSVPRDVPVKVTVFNYDDAPHSFTAPALHLNEIIPGAKAGKPGKLTFTLKAVKAGRYAWWCTQPCDPWAMSHDGYMRGFVTVA